MQDIAPWVVTILVAVANIAFTVVQTNKKASADSLNRELELIRTQISLSVGRVDIVEDRVSRIETEMEHLPDKDSMHTLALQVSEQRSDIRALAQSVDNTRKSVEGIRKSVDALTQMVEGNGNNRH